MIATLVNVHAVELAVIFKASLAPASGHSLLDETGAVGTTIDTVTGVLADKVDALSVKGTIGVVEALHLLTACLVVEGVTGEKAYFGTLALRLVIDYTANCMRSTGTEGAQIDTSRDALLVTSTGSIRGTVHIASWTFTRILATSPSIADFALPTRAPIAAGYIFTDC